MDYEIKVACLLLMYYGEKRLFVDVCYNFKSCKFPEWTLKLEWPGCMYFYWMSTDASPLWF